MKVRRRLRLLAGGLVSTLALGACGLLPGGDDEPAGTAAPAPVERPFELAGVCPNPVVIQTDWYPESEYGATYNLVGDGYRVDAKNKKVRGPMVVEGRPTGVDVEVRSGGPAIEFAKISEQMYTDRGITLGFVNTEQAAQLYAKSPTLSVVAPMDISPGAIMWSPEKHPDWNTMVDIGQDDARVLVTADDLFAQYLVGTGILKAKQVDTGYDGSPNEFVKTGGTIAQGGFATAEPYVYQEELPDWGREMDFQLVHDTGFEAYTQTLSIRTGDKEKLAPCLRKLVPLIQRSAVDFITKPQRTNRLITQLVNEQYKDPIWNYSPELANFSVRQQLALGIVGNGSDETIGNFDLARVSGVLEIVRSIFAGRRAPLKEGLRAEDLATNEFIDPSISLRASAAS